MKYADDLLARYVAAAPLALAFERFLECKIYLTLSLPHPILDIGCGEGLFANIVFAEQIDTGIDPDEHELARAHELGAYDELIACPGNAIPKPSGAYNTVFANSVLEHIPDLIPVLHEVHRVLAPAGRFYCTVPSNYFDQYTVVNMLLTRLGLTKIAARYRRFYSAFWKHYHYYALEEWTALMQQAGFRVVEAYTYDPKRICLLNDFLVPFSLPSKVIKSLTNRWVLFPAVRHVLYYPIVKLAERFLLGGEKAEQGGLVFMSLQKI